MPNLQLEMPRLFNADVPIKDLRYFTDLKRPQNKNPNKQNLCELLIEFFDFYANRIDFPRDVLSISCGMKKVLEQTVFSTKRQSFVYIEELYDPSKNAAKRSDVNCYEKIKQSFHDALNELREKPNLTAIGVRE